jgi:AAHS family benzoate transporter-like MFS transporter
VPDGKEERGGFKDLFHPRLLVMTILMWLTYLFSMTVVYGLSTWLPSLFVRAGFSLSQSYSFGIIQALGATLGGYLLGWFMDRYGRKQTLAAMYLLGGCSVLLFGFASSAAGLYAAGLATGMLVFAAPTLLNVVCGETYPTSIRATGLGWANAAGRIGSVVGPLLGGMLHGKEGGPTPFFVVFSVPAFVCALFVLLYRVNARGQSLEEASEALQTPNGKD